MCNCESFGYQTIISRTNLVWFSTQPRVVQCCASKLRLLEKEVFHINHLIIKYVAPFTTCNITTKHFFSHLFFSPPFSSAYYTRFTGLHSLMYFVGMPRLISSEIEIKNQSIWFDKCVERLTFEIFNDNGERLLLWNISSLLRKVRRNLGNAKYNSVLLLYFQSYSNYCWSKII